MKANELMVGDWVSWNGNNLRVKGTGEEDTYFGIDAPEDIVPNEEVKPIPFTLEMFDANDLQFPETILDKNGDDPVDWNTLSFMFYRIDLEELQTEVWEADIKHDQRNLLNGACTKITFHYVHELQHALRLCGLNDLADNFKLK